MALRLFNHLQNHAGPHAKHFQITVVLIPSFSKDSFGGFEKFEGVARFPNGNRDLPNYCPPKVTSKRMPRALANEAPSNQNSTNCIFQNEESTRSISRDKHGCGPTANPRTRSDFHAARSSRGERARPSTTGSTIDMRVPAPGAVSISRVPFQPCTMAMAIDRPNPVPSVEDLVVKNG